MRQTLAIHVALCTAIGTGLGAHAADRVDSLSIAVNVFADTKVTREVLESAKAEAGRIFSTLGVELLWRADPSASDIGLTIRVIDRPIKGASKWAMGMAIPDRTGAESFCFAFLSRVEEFARRHERPLGQILGHVIAHEMGHLLLPTIAHSNSGIMVADWNRGQIMQLNRGYLSFTSAQADNIRNKIRSWGSR